MSPEIGEAFAECHSNHLSAMAHRSPDELIGHEVVVLGGTCVVEKPLHFGNFGRRSDVGEPRPEPVSRRLSKSSSRGCCRASSPTSFSIWSTIPSRYPKASSASCTRREDLSAAEAPSHAASAISPPVFCSLIRHDRPDAVRSQIVDPRRQIEGLPFMARANRLEHLGHYANVGQPTQVRRSESFQPAGSTTSCPRI